MTNRFLLRDFNDADADAFEAYHRNPRSHAFYDVEKTRPEHARELIALFRAWAAAQPRRNYQLAIVQRREPQALIGCCGVRCADAEPGAAELGIELAPDYWGRYGYAIEVMHALVKFAFSHLDLQIIYGVTVDANFRVSRLARSFGATAVTRPTPAWMSGRGWTQVEWRVTRQQWRSSRLTRRYSKRTADIDRLNAGYSESSGSA